MKSNQGNYIWVLLCFVLMLLIGFVFTAAVPTRNSSIETEVPVETTIPVSKHCLKRIDINTKYNDGASCKFYVDPATNIVYMTFDSYDVDGVTVVFHPKTGRPLLLDDFYKIYAEYIPES